jgi:hypothetical protein
MRDHAAAPIDERAECIEEQGANSVHGAPSFPYRSAQGDLCRSRILLEGKGIPPSTRLEIKAASGDASLESR